MSKEQERTTDPSVDVLIHQVSRMANDMDDIKMSMKELSQSMSRLALAEERITQTNSNLERVFKSLEVITARVAELERKAAVFAITNLWVDKAMWLAFGGLATFAAKKVGMFA